MKDTLKAVATGAVLLIGSLVVVWLFQGNDFFLYKTFAPKYEQVRRETFEETKSYKQGMVQQLRDLQLSYSTTADSLQQKAIGAMMIHVAADFPDKDMPKDLAKFMQELRQKQGITTP